MARHRPRSPTVSMAKNFMRRAADAIIDPYPPTDAPMWEFFDSRCAYCGSEIDPVLRQGHRDHARSGGGNHLGNLVLACNICNGDEKREADWREFLLAKAPDAPTFRTRERRILEWFELNPPLAARQSPEVTQLRAEVEVLVDTFGAKCRELREVVQRAGST